MLKLQLTISVMVMIINIIAMVFELTIWHLDPGCLGAIHSGKCSTTTSSLNIMLHMAINILSSLILGAGNYCKQLLVAPSRSQVDHARSKGVFLEIGVPSLINLRNISLQKRHIVATPWTVFNFITPCVSCLNYAE